MKIIVLVASTVFSCALLGTVGPESYTAEVVGISDGDTITVLTTDKQQVKVRLYGIDAPESKQAFGSRAKEMLSAKIFGKSVRIVRRDVDRYGRTVAEVILDDARGGEQNINRELVADGFAWWYQKYAPNDMSLAKAEKEARAAKRGLWSDAAPVAPWEYRMPAVRPDSAGKVWITAGGKKYHRGDCRHLDATARALPLEEARQTRTPCKTCRPE